MNSLSPTGEVDPLETKFEKHDVGEFTSKGDALICLSALQQKAPSDYKYKLIEK